MCICMYVMQTFSSNYYFLWKVVFRILQFYDPEEITTIMMKSFSIIADTLVSINKHLLKFNGFSKQLYYFIF